MTKPDVSSIAPFFIVKNVPDANRRGSRGCLCDELRILVLKRPMSQQPCSDRRSSLNLATSCVRGVLTTNVKAGRSASSAVAADMTTW